MAANSSAAQNGTEKMSTDALTTVNGVNVVADLIEVQRLKMGFGPDGALIDVTDITPMPVTVLNNGFVSVVNSSASVLLLNGVLTGTGEDVSGHALITVSVFSSHASATDGLQLQQSTNNLDWDFVDSYTIPATTGKTFSVAVVAKYFRVVYTNGGIMQTAFRLQTIYSKEDKKPSSVRSQDGRSNDNDFVEVLSYPMAWNGVSWDRVKGRNGRLGVDTDSFRAVTFRGRATSFKTPGRAAVSQKILSIHNATASPVLVDVNRIRVDMLSTGVKAVTVVTPIIRVVRYTVVQTNGTVLTKGAVDSSLTSNASVTVTGDASADGTLSATTLTLTPTQALAQAYAPRVFTAVGYEIMDTIVFFEGETNITLRPLEGLAVFLDNAVITTGIPATDIYAASVDWTEYTAV